MEEEITVDTGGDGDLHADAVDGERLNRMLELEEQLLEERRGLDGEEDAEDEPPEEEPEEVEAAVGHIRSVEPAGDDIRVTFFVSGGDVEEDVIPMPDDASDPDAAVNRLCELCGVEPGRVADLQGERVPIVPTDDGHEIHLPTATSRPALGVYRVWWWMRRRDIDPDAVLAAAGVGGAGAIYLLGLRSIVFYASTTGESADPGEAVGAIVPFLTEAMFAGSSAMELIGLVFSLLLFFLALLTGMLTVGVGLIVAFDAATMGANWIEDNVNPF